MSAANQNGQWPHDVQRELEREPPSVPVLPLNASPRELALAMGSVLVGWAPIWRAILAALEYLRGALIGARGVADRSLEVARETQREVLEVKVVAIEIAKRLGVTLTSPVGNPATATTLPPMRDPEISTVSLVELREGIKQAAEEGERRKDTSAAVQVDLYLEGWMARRSEKAEVLALRTRETLRKERRASILKWALGVLAAAASGWIGHILTSLHWH